MFALSLQSFSDSSVFDVEHFQLKTVQHKHFTLMDQNGRQVSSESTSELTELFYYSSAVRVYLATKQNVKRNLL